MRHGGGALNKIEHEVKCVIGKPIGIATIELFRDLNCVSMYQPQSISF